ncbi:BlaI/MecI/CopY family transcriptional regulator [Dactylosporangium vinaceum]|uniref:BlaI/MecI/CopY family transcriptional regulator n=1 Tax=Dactylosporangium vinaceum TaxID=53362 RepID=A0ABV5M985_9ACTN|nr:BlaI/MecI/CopY family transcriptional regulator [Dactylosporangium vinaceum]UAB99942.1 BlaI/MecI/CopY family transcriptional regulator [Dactylosporangium vinaceum]
MGSLEADVLAVLRATPGPLTPAQVLEGLGRGAAYNTIQTILTRLLDKGLTRRGPSPHGGRGHVYRPTHGTPTVIAQQMRALLNGPGDRRAVLREFTAELDPADAAVLRGLLAQVADDPA